MLRQIAYISVAELDDFTAEIDGILETSRVRNKADGLTGVLLFAHGVFLQILEGEAKSLRALMQRISHDSRHSGVTTLLDREIADRQFAEWNMGWYRVPHDHPAAEEIRKLGDPKAHQGSPRVNDDPVTMVIDSFFEMNRAHG